MSSRRVLPILVLLVSSALPALAATGGTPVVVSQTGYVLDAADQPLTGSVDLSFGVYATDTGGSAEWAGTCTGVAVRGGYYAIDVGAGCTGTGGVGDSVLDTSDLPPGAARWLEVRIGLVTLTPRLSLTSAPTAARAVSADRVGNETAANLHDASRLTGVAPASVLGTGSAQITTVGTIATGTWQGTAITDSFVASAATWNAKLGSVAHDATLSGSVTTLSPLSIGTDGSALQNVNAAKLGGMTLSEVLSSATGGGAGGQANAGSASPGACGPTTTGLLWFDTTVSATPTLKICNGAYYVALGGAVTAPPGPPAAPTLTVADQSIGVSWSAVASATAYEIGYAPGSSIGSSPTVVLASGTSSTLTGLTNGTGYAVAVRTVANAWRSDWSTPTLGTPAAVRTIVTFGTGRRWSDGTYALNCKAYRSPTYPFTYAGSTGDGLYTIDPDGAASGAPFDAQCDMGRWSGGWTLVYRNAGQNYVDNTADNVPPTPAKTRAKFASSVINQISGQSSGSGGNAYEMIIEGPTTQTLMKASEPFYVEMNLNPVTVQYDCDKNGVYEKSKTWNAWYTDRGASEGSTWMRDWVYPQNGQCNAWNGGNVLQFWPGTSTTPGNTGTGAPIVATASAYSHNGSILFWVR